MAGAGGKEKLKLKTKDGKEAEQVLDLKMDRGQDGV